MLLKLALPLGGAFIFFLLSLATVRLARPREPRRYFLIYAIALLGGTAFAYWRLPSLGPAEDAVGIVAVLLVQLVLCLTMWNAFYSLLWGFSGGLSYDLVNDPAMRQLDRLVRAYEGEGDVDRMMARRMPNLVRGGYIEVANGTMHLRGKGRVIALGTLAAFRIFSLGMGGGVK